MRIVAVQSGPASDDLEVNLARTRELILDLPEAPDLVVLPELFSRPFWCTGLTDPRFFDWAEDLEGPTLEAMRRVARETSAVLVVPFFERGQLAGEYFNSAALIDAQGELILGVLPNQERVSTYRKNAISSFQWDGAVNDEKYYFRPGPGFPIFESAHGPIGLLICYDRWYPEAWRVLALQGARIVCVMNASHGSVSELFVPSIRICAAQNLLFAVAVNRAGVEVLEGKETEYYGSSCIVDPVGALLAEAGRATDAGIVADVDLEDVGRQRVHRTMYRDRRPELYGLISRGGEGGA